ncbi:pyruvate kinase 1, cytosolic [Senna tora]|uniref:Pyruvate kinase 1, cytosolic n=1 Tax=Senna tora TaxID=362788 RepID=A0A834WFZ7_9FABA|nr:pyruvate kinase 1, cytosolic [Senna tora]
MGPAFERERPCFTPGSERDENASAVREIDNAGVVKLRREPRKICFRVRSKLASRRGGERDENAGAVREIDNADAVKLRSHVLVKFLSRFALAAIICHCSSCSRRRFPFPRGFTPPFSPISTRFPHSEVKGQDVVCVIKNSATLAGALFTLHPSQEVVTVMAKDLVRTQHDIEKFYKLKS